MATGQNHFSFTAYGKVSTYDALNGGWQVMGNGFSGPRYLSAASAGCNFIGLSPTVTVGNVVCNAIVEILPTGLALPSFTIKYLTDSTLAALQAAAQ
jgi:hypothetical protein